MDEVAIGCYLFLDPCCISSSNFIQLASFFLYKTRMFLLLCHDTKHDTVSCPRPDPCIIASPQYAMMSPRDPLLKTTIHSHACRVLRMHRLTILLQSYQHLGATMMQRLLVVQEDIVDHALRDSTALLQLLLPALARYFPFLVLRNHRRSITWPFCVCCALLSDF